MYSTSENSIRCDVWRIIQLASTVLFLSLGSSSAFTTYYDTGARISSLRARISTGLSSTASPPSEESTTATVQKKKPRAWFPVKPEDALLTQYDTLVRGAFVRHVVMETEAVTDLALQTYLRGNIESYENLEDKMDPFGKLARDLSACVKSREEAGKVGWVDNPFHPDFVDRERNNDVTSELISPRVIEQMFQKRPKGGDVLKLKYSANTSEGNEDEFDFKGKKDQWHLCRVDDLMVDYINSEKDDSTRLMEEETLAFKQRGVNKVITNRSKLKGLGTTPIAPKFIQEGSENLEDQDGKGHIAKTYHIATSGCQMNVADSERLAGVLQNNLKLTPAQNPAKADVVILNTCSIRDHAEQKVYDALGPYAARKRRGEPLALIVAGCVAQQEGEALLKRVPETDLVLGPQYVSRLGDLLDDVSRGHQVVATDPTLLSEDLSRPVRGHDVRAWINIINGCNEHCTYCVVPGVRGVEQSRPMEFILKECLDLAEAGFKEVTLLGQNIDAYGRDLTPRRNFADLLHYLNDAIPDGTIERIRYVTSHPRYFSDRVIDAVATLDKVCECFHMPFQSGGDIVLKNMRRGYTFDSYMKIIKKIKEKAPDASICGDVIVGFPGETDEQFQRTLDLMNEVKFDNLNTFAYSPRPNTEAALWDNQISEEVKSERLQIVQRLAAQHGMERSERYVGTTIPILVEDRNPRNMNQVMGRTRQSRQVFFDGDIDELKGKTVEVKIVEARPWSLVGETV
eukprot:CAMPEP_0194089944 /NCGR_PEP_ID=MMETSP0149-20130528/36735_1 /TAXON_ID=122233 /ORGANISM="Chaetoceros debilis, Strain MM31A-1" /LENGTH=740 /DNA_ID=CAMNT_0038774035 /DNA_START=72 /DNA_END=2294 /DNA_ORIENTATION=-